MKAACVFNGTEIEVPSCCKAKTSDGTMIKVNDASNYVTTEDGVQLAGGVRWACQNSPSWSTWSTSISLAACASPTRQFSSSPMVLSARACASSLSPTVILRVVAAGLRLGYGVREETIRNVNDKRGRESLLKRYRIMNRTSYGLIINILKRRMLIMEICTIAGCASLGITEITRARPPHNSEEVLAEVGTHLVACDDADDLVLEGEHGHMPDPKRAEERKAAGNRAELGHRHARRVDVRPQVEDGVRRRVDLKVGD